MGRRDPNRECAGRRARRDCAPPFRALVIGVMLAGLGGCAGSPHAESPLPPVAPAPEATSEMSTPYGDFLAARHAENVNDADLSARLFGRVLRHAPANPTLMRLALHQSLAAGRMDEAAALAARYLEIRPKSVMAGLTMAVEEVRAGKLAAAAKRLEGMPKSGLAAYFVPLSLAWTLAGEGKTDQALSALAPLGEKRGFATIYDLHAALIFERGGDLTRAKRLFAKVSKGDSLHQRLVTLAGAFFERHGDRQRAVQLYTDYLKQDPDSDAISRALARARSAKPAPAMAVTTAADGMAEALWDLGMLLSQERVRDIAMMMTRMALRLKPKLMIARILLGDILEDMDRPDAALAVYDAVPHQSDMGWMARMRAAGLLERNDRTREALQRLDAMARERPDKVDAIVLRGDILRYRKRYDEAIKSYDEAIKRIGKPERRHWSLYYARGIAFERSKQWPRAERDFLTALKLQPNQPLVLNYLGYSWVEQRRHLKRALAMIEKAVQLRPNDGYIVDSLGWAHYQLGDYKRAVVHLERAVLLQPQDSAINDHLGDAYWHMGRKLEALFQWQRALGFDPEPAEIPKIEAKIARGLTGPAPTRESSGVEPGNRGG